MIISLDICFSDYISKLICIKLFCRLLEIGTPPSNVYKRQSLQPVKKLTTLDLYSGCGGLSCGLKNCGLTESKWAVEMDTKAAQAFKTNFPACKVYNEDVSMWFQNLKVKFMIKILDNIIQPYTTNS
jgi:C-5 cytosine-specific DNA methylase